MFGEDCKENKNKKKEWKHKLLLLIIYNKYKTNK